MTKCFNGTALPRVLREALVAWDHKDTWFVPTWDHIGGAKKHRFLKTFDLGKPKLHGYGCMDMDLDMDMDLPIWMYSAAGETRGVSPAIVSPARRNLRCT